MDFNLSKATDKLEISFTYLAWTCRAMSHGKVVGESSTFAPSESSCSDRQSLGFDLQPRGAIESESSKLLSPKHRRTKSWKVNFRKVKAKQTTYLDIEQIGPKNFLHTFVHIIRSLNVLKHSSQLVDGVRRHANMSQVVNVPDFFLLNLRIITQFSIFF